MIERFCFACGLRAYEAEVAKDDPEKYGCSGCFKATKLCTCRPITDQVIDLKREWDTERQRLKRKIEELERRLAPAPPPHTRMFVSQRPGKAYPSNPAAAKRVKERRPK